VSRPIIVIGGGGHGRVVIEALRCAGLAIAGVIDPDEQVKMLLPPEIPWLGGEEALGDFAPADYELANGVGSIGGVKRRGAFESLKSRGYSFATVRHPSAVIPADGVVLAEGCQIMAGAVLQPRVRLGANVIVNTCAAIDHDCSIGAHSHVSPGAVLCGDVTVGEETHIGAGAVVIQGLRIGRSCMIGAGATVLRDVADGLVVYSEAKRRERKKG
jgi:sugar O-acyltransferase (sialic acid O-acetyltransferase NeuD family)